MKTTIIRTQIRYSSRQHTEHTHVIEEEDDLKGHPFTKEITEAQLPPKWKVLNIKLYDDTIDLDKHMNVYETQMNLYTTNKSIWCKVFPASLKE